MFRIPGQDQIVTTIGKLNLSDISAISLFKKNLLLFIGDKHKLFAAVEIGF